MDKSSDLISVFFDYQKIQTDNLHATLFLDGKIPLQIRMRPVFFTLAIFISL